jgi:prophage antirepressor-like protein
MSYNYPTTKDSSHNEIKVPMNTKNICGIDCYEQNGVAYLRLENVARGLGFTQEKNGVEYVRWETIRAYLSDLGFSQLVGKDDFIPENIFYRLAMKAKNETAEKFQALVADEIIPSIRKNGIYATDNVIDEILNNPDFGIELLTKLKQERQARVEAERKNAILTHVNKTYTMTEIAKELNLKSAIQLNKLLADKKFNTVSMELGFFTHHTAVWDMKKLSKKSSTMVRLFITGE